MNAQELARKNGFDDARDTNLFWNDYKVYEPIFNDNEMHTIGLPHSILEKDGIARFTTVNECFEVLDLITPKTNSED